jgi:Ca2+-dependent lipid-binding protein
MDLGFTMPVLWVYLRLANVPHSCQILFAVLSTRFITTIRLGWGWVILILVACASYYTLSIKRTRERARDDMQRELVKTRLVTETESADWMNSFLERFWLM